MKLTKKDEKDLMKVYDAWWHSYLNGDVQTYDSYLADDFRFIGSTNNEDYLNRKDTTKFFENTAEQMSGKAELRNLQRTMDVIEKNLVLITDLANAYILSNSEWIFYSRFRFTSLIKKTKKGWLFTYQHFSAPDNKAQDGETLGTEKITRENQELRDAIKRRTVELEHKNKELSIEAAIERIRVQAVAMKASSDLLDIVVTMRKEFTGLGHEAHYFWHMLWLEDKYEKAMTSGDGTRIGFVMELPRHIHGDVPLLANWEKSEDSIVIYPMDAEAAVNYVDKMITLGDFQNIDPQAPSHDDVRLIGGLTFIMARTSHGEIGYSLPGVVENPPTEDLELLKRFADAFDLAHRRFLDLQKAENQAREVQIELALEKVRSRTMAMQHSDELQEAAYLMFQQIEILGISAFGCGFNIWDDDRKAATSWMAGENRIQSPFKTSSSKDIFVRILSAANKGDSLYVEEQAGKALDNHYRYMVSIPAFKEIVDKMAVNGHSLPSFQIMHCAFFSQGYLMFISFAPVVDAHDVFKRFATVFEQTYTRFLDLQKAETQAREAKIETALEKVRSQSMGMQTSEDLSHVTNAMFEQLRLLGGELYATGIVFCDKHENNVEQWHSIPNAGMVSPFIVPVNLDYIHQYRYDQWKKGTALFSIEIPSDFIDQHFQDIFDLPSAQKVLKNLEEKNTPIPEPPPWEIDYGASFKNGYVLVSALQPFEEANILPRFAKVFEQTYTRFLDLQKAEAQARESQIEAALERIRSKSMGMQKSDELTDLSLELVKQVQYLGVATWFCAFNIYDDHEEGSMEWGSNGQGVFPRYRTPREGIFLEYYQAGQNGETFLVNEIGEDQCPAHYEYLCNLPGVGDQLLQMKEQGIAFPTYQIDHVAFFKFGYIIFISYESVPEAHETFQRFAKVFEQTYTRFLDLQKAEAQTREAQINLAVERVRAKALAMHKSEEIMEVVAKLKDEVMNLDIPDVIAATIFLKEGEDKVRMWDLSTLEKNNDGYQIPFDITFKLKKKDPNLYVKRVWENQENYFLELQEVKEFKRIIAWLRENHKTEVADEVEEFIETTQLKQLHHAVKKLTNGKLVIDLLNTPHDEMETILTKMGAAFDLAYKRFEDLKNSEAQLREAQIEAALERVRSRSMAMHKSEELLEVISVVSEQLQQLEFKFNHVSFANNDIGEDYKFWTASKAMPNPMRFTIPYVDIAVINNLRKAQEKSLSFITDSLTKDDHKQWHEHLLNNGGADLFSKKENEYIMSKGVARSVAVNPNILLILANYASIPYSEEENKIIERFGKVFEQSYTRFLDLQKAEAQVRESKIEAALEKVRSRSLAMHQPDELKDVVIVIVEKLQELGVVLDANGVVLCTYFNDSKDVLHWIASPDFSFAGSYLLPYFDHPIFSVAWQSKEKGDDYFSKAFTVEEKNSFFEYAFEHSDYRHFPDEFKQWIFKNDKHILSFAWQKHSAILIPSHTGMVPNESEKEILKRFSNVFEQAYIRFMDLQKSEAQARESLIEIGLERVRSRTLAMQTSDELAETAVVLFKQLIDLGIAPNRLFIGIIKNDGATLDAWATNEDGSKIASHFILQGPKNNSIKKMLEGWKQHKKTLVIDLKGKELKDYFQYLNEEMNIPFIGGLEQKRRVQTIAYFSGGLIGMASPNDQPQETIQLLARFAAVFNLTYTRFNDLKVSEAQTRKAEEDLVHLQLAKKSAEDALVELQHTQKQLIQSEKMASLGELTAGIAHEIQNPLNFVNNFSEVSNELIDEMNAEIEKGDLEEVKFIMADIKSNLEKINHHGKRADAIVKGMLQHSRTNSAEKEPTDINKLADEYLRLSYHGLRAKDKSFNATLETDYDATIGQIDVIPQEIGRVILNLITNAFYACNEKKKSGIDNYEPTVTVSTKKQKNSITISVKDNGNGIPKNIVDKIFQPFFTTKPTGQGTGLGLSMSYDIITKGHGGELTVDTTEGEGTKLIIFIPIN